MSVLFIGKRFYTGRDALCEQYGRIFKLPWHWAQAGIETELWLVDYHSKETARERIGRLDVVGTPVRTGAVIKPWYRHFFSGSERPSTIVASGDCYIGLMAFHLSRRLGARFVFDVYDKYDEFDGYRRVPGFDPFRFLLSRSDSLLFASRGLMQQMGRGSEHDLLVPNGIDAESFKPHDKLQSRKVLGLNKNGVLIGYFGGMTRDRGVDDLIAAVRLVRAKGIDIELLLGGNARPGMDLASPGVRYLGNVPYSEMPVVLACCDLLAVPYRRSAFMDAGASNKIAESIFSRRPLVATRTPNMLENFPEQAAALGEMLAEPGNVEDLARVIIEQCERRVLLRPPDGFEWGEIAARAAACLSKQNGYSHCQTVAEEV